MTNRRPTGLLLFIALLPLAGLVACSSEPAAVDPTADDGAAPPPTASTPTPGTDASALPDAAKPSEAGADAAKPPTCTDAIKNGTETDVDCGGTCPTKCAISKGCAAPSDCATNTCLGGVCRAATSTDGVKNGSETDVDCGGTDAPPCAPGKDCSVGGDCASLLCTAGKCTTPTPTDGVKNGTETDVDCGGTDAATPRCAPPQACAVAGDCTTGVCTGGVCRAATSTDGVKNGTETDVDCGGTDAPACAPGKDCGAGGDCESRICTAGKCTTPTPTDGVKNGTETDVDCGGPDAATPRCAPPQACVAAADCDSGVCTGGVCQAPTPTDGVKNGTETDVDCGGPDPATPRCEATKACATGADCASLVCPGNLCQAPSPADGVQNGTETDVDCGGPDVLTPRCTAPQACAVATDCDSAVCTGNICQAPTPTDGVKNGTETDVDCGGADLLTPRCGDGGACVAGPDCRTGSCAGNVCDPPKSCAGGGRGKNNCGPGADESCCTSLRVPDFGDLPPEGMRDAEGRYRYNRANNASLPAWVSPFYLDKFEITQGRMRTFLTTYGGNLYGALNLPDGAGEHPHIPASGWRSSFASRLPRNMNEVRDRFTFACGEGGDNANGGAATWTTAVSANDDKPITCVDWYTLLAFCIWDGGSLPTEAEWGYAAEGGDEQRTYAWGPVPSATDADWMATPSLAPATHAFCTDGGTPAYPNCFSWGTPYRLPGDGAAHISPAGRRQDIARWGHHDMTGNLIEWTLDYRRTPGACVDCADVGWPDPPFAPGSYPSSWATVGAPGLTGTAHEQDGPRIMRGGSWERHALSTRTTYPNYPLYRSYYASGARCWRPE